MITSIVSDIHLGTLEGFDLARSGEAGERLIESVSEADRVIVLGDLLELRERPLRAVLDAARPAIERIGRATAGRRLTLVPGNHDYGLAAPWLSQARLEGADLGPEQEWRVGPEDGLAGRLAEWMPDTELTVAYPGFRPRPDVYVTHGHYLDAHLTVPRVESIAAALIGRVAGRTDPHSVADHEAMLSPLYSLLDSLGQHAAPNTLKSGTSLSRRVWAQVNGSGQGGAAGFLLGRVAIPGAVVALNAAGVGHFRSDLTGQELRRAGLQAMRTVVGRTGVRADYVVFGHTHRAGPLPGDDPAEWALGEGSSLVNSGSWLHEPVLLGEDPESSPYFPGTVVRLREEGPPDLDGALRGFALPSSAAA
ncbi:MAG TPA: metallophosphoesterase [Thermoleophilaceae bacterium]|nr:metallophosphoesterase [Thermoleophilaceae bacterium]